MIYPLPAKETWIRPNPDFILRRTTTFSEEATVSKVTCSNGHEQTEERVSSHPKSLLILETRFLPWGAEAKHAFIVALEAADAASIYDSSLLQNLSHSIFTHVQLVKSNEHFTWHKDEMIQWILLLRDQFRCKLHTLVFGTCVQERTDDVFVLDGGWAMWCIRNIFIPHTKSSGTR